MNIGDFPTADDAAARLANADQLVEAGLSRERAEKLLKRLYAILDGPWTDLLAKTKVKSGRSIEESLEDSLIQTFLVAYLAQWVDERLLLGEAKQALAFRFFSALDAKSKDTI